ncbi:MAG TPA: porin family protein [Pricia sp.]|nr:porin family protein [Pricia sp.]
MGFKIFVSVVTLFFGVAGSNAQVFQGTSGSDGIEALRFGAKAGLDVSTFLGSDFVDISPKLGAYIGGLAEIPAFFDNFYLQPEILLSFQGADTGPENLNLTYIHLPLMGKYHITDAIAVEFGPQLGFLIADNNEDLGGVDINTVHVGLNFGGGYRLNDTFYFQLRFGPGLSRVIDDVDLRNGVISLGACYFF